MRGETLDSFAFLRDVIAALADATPVLRQLVLRDISISLKISLWAASRFLRKMIAIPNPEVYGKGDRQYLHQ